MTQSPPPNPPGAGLSYSGPPTAPEAVGPPGRLSHLPIHLQELIAKTDMSAKSSLQEGYYAWNPPEWPSRPAEWKPIASGEAWGTEAQSDAKAPSRVVSPSSSMPTAPQEPTTAPASSSSSASGSSSISAAGPSQSASERRAAITRPILDQLRKGIQSAIGFSAAWDSRSTLFHNRAWGEVHRQLHAYQQRHPNQVEDHLREAFHANKDQDEMVEALITWIKTPPLKTPMRDGNALTSGTKAYFYAEGYVKTALERVFPNPPPNALEAALGRPEAQAIARVLIPTTSSSDPADRALLGDTQLNHLKRLAAALMGSLLE